MLFIFYLFQSSSSILNKRLYLATLSDQANDHVLILRGDILPPPSKDFISLIKYSLPDVLLTGDQSVTDGIGYSNLNKIVWYQVCPW